VAGGQNNIASGYASAVAGGEQNQALGAWSLAAGRFAYANHDGTFVFGDSQFVSTLSTKSNQFLIRAQNGVGINTASPATALDVNGTATFTGLRLSTSPSAGALLTSDASGNGTWSPSINAASLPSNLAFANSNQTFTASNLFSGVLKATNLNNVLAGDGSGLTNLNPARMASGTANINISGNAGTATTANGVAPNAVGTSGILDGAITGTKIADGSVNTNDLSGQVLTNTFWRMTGNAGTDPANNFIGTTDNKAFAVRVNGGRGLEIDPVSSGLFASSVNILAGGNMNLISSGVLGGVIAGGGVSAPGTLSDRNQVLGDFGTVSGGSGNSATNDATVVGGGQNQALGSYAVVAGGISNYASAYSFAAGTQAKANHSGSFVWADNSGGDFATARSNTFIIRAAGGVGIGVTNPVPLAALDVGGNVYVEGDTLQLRGSTNLEYPYLRGRNGAVELGGGTALLKTIRLWNVAAADYMDLMAGQITCSGPVNTSGYPVNLSGSLNGLGYNTDFGGQTVNGPVLYGQTSGALGINADAVTKHGVLFWNTSGVGINMNNPNGASLYVKGDRPGLWQQSVGWFENINGSSNTSPALRVVTDSGNTPDGALSVSANGTGLIARFGNSSDFVADIRTNGTIDAVVFNPTSDRNAKEHFKPVDALAVLEKVTALPISEWNYKVAEGIRHVGPMAQDFQAAFNLGEDDKHIATVDADGVALAAIQGLNLKLTEELERRDVENTELKQRLEKLEQLVNQKQRDGQ